MILFFLFLDFGVWVFSKLLKSSRRYAISDLPEEQEGLVSILTYTNSGISSLNLF